VEAAVRGARVMMDQPYEAPAYLGEVDVEISTFSYMTHQDLAALQDELNEHVLAVTTRRLNIGPPAAGSELVVVLAIAASAATSVLAGFFQELGKDAYQALRGRLLDVYEKARGYDRSLANVPMRFELGRVWFYFTGSFSEDEFSECLRRADAILRELPDDHLDAGSERPVLELAWNHESKSWEEVSLGATLAANRYFRESN
jgi:hypothetical protein